ncbi:MAG TPA: hypothetical protein PLX85_00930, partial [Dehalococcoidia bacterium]|nr:hypothetical protein [Dehalococcoidia bacterium]
DEGIGGRTTGGHEEREGTGGMSTDGFAITRGARREILLRGPLTEQQLGASDEEVAYLDAHSEFQLDAHGRWQARRLPGMTALTPDDRRDAMTAARLLILNLESVPGGVRDRSAPLSDALGDRAERIYAAARDGLIAAGLVAAERGKLTDRTGDLYRMQRPAWTPKWTQSAVVVPVQEAPAPTPVEPEPTAPKPARVVEKVAAPKPATVEKPAPAPVVKQPPTPVTPDITAAITRLAEASERQAEILSVAVSEGRLERPVRSEHDAARDDLARRLCVLVGAEGQMRRGQITAGRLSKPQRKLASDALTFALGYGALKHSAGWYELGDPTRIGWTRDGFVRAVEEQVEKKRKATERKAAADANAAIAATRDRVTGRAS